MEELKTGGEHVSFLKFFNNQKRYESPFFIGTSKKYIFFFYLDDTLVS